VQFHQDGTVRLPDALEFWDQVDVLQAIGEQIIGPKIENKKNAKNVLNWVK
jgi:virulence-associated protein VagC